MTAFLLLAVPILVIVTALICVVAFSAKTIKPYELGLVVVLGSYRKTIGPGFHIVPLLAQIHKVDMRPRMLSIPESQFGITTGSVRLSAEIVCQTTDPVRATFGNRDVDSILMGRAQEAIGAVLIGALPPDFGLTTHATADEVARKLGSSGAELGEEVRSVSLRAREFLSKGHDRASG